jgi:hypothetical protein
MGSLKYDHNKRFTTLTSDYIMRLSLYLETKPLSKHQLKARVSTVLKEKLFKSHQVVRKVVDLDGVEDDWAHLGWRGRRTFCNT